MLLNERRLRPKADFDRIFKTGRVIDSPGVRIIWTRGHGRAAVVAAKAIGSLARRNQVRRRWREAMRLLADTIPCEVDLIAVVMPAGSAMRGEDAVHTLREALQQIKI